MQFYIKIQSGGMDERLYGTFAAPDPVPSGIYGYRSGEQGGDHNEGIPRI
ncbi:hypothetical protein SDC9_194182 [bioreactor metagenome]|uniref:Uncharacterized protein n=1 Tax=bioreactor metagenome TaxID=1076179 RepID=A0A645I5K8_9ZZZZ